MALVTPIFFALVGRAVPIGQLTLATAAGRATLFGFAAALLDAATLGKILTRNLFSELAGSRTPPGAPWSPAWRSRAHLLAGRAQHRGLSSDLISALALVIAATTLARLMLARRCWTEARSSVA